MRSRLRSLPQNSGHNGIPFAPWQAVPVGPGARLKATARKVYFTEVDTVFSFSDQTRLEPQQSRCWLFDSKVCWTAKTK